MAGMNQEQRRYAMKRVEEIRKVKADALKEKHTKKAKSPSDKDMLRAVKDHSVSIPYAKRVTLDTSLRDAFDFGRMDAEDVFDRKSYNRDYEKLRKEVAKVSDEIMLGDSEAAKKMLEKFESSV